MSLQPETESDINNTNDSDNADSNQVVSSTTDEVLLKSKGILLVTFLLWQFIN